MNYLSYYFVIYLLFLPFNISLLLNGIIYSLANNEYLIIHLIATNCELFIVLVLNIYCSLHFMTYYYPFFAGDRIDAEILLRRNQFIHTTMALYRE